MSLPSGTRAIQSPPRHRLSHRAGVLAAGHAENLTRLHDELIHKDWFQTLPDFNAYVVRKGQALSDYAYDPMGWCKVSGNANIAKVSMFSSDRTIAEYNRDIWHLGK